MDRVPVARLANDHDLSLVVHTVRGSRPGPKLAMFGSVHGDEPMGSETIRRVLTQLDPAELRGTIVAVPVTNPYAHQALTRSTPLDGVNMNRIFPGSPDGSVTERLADALTGILRQDVTHFVDYHSGGNFALVDYSYIHEPGAEMSRAFGRHVLYSGPGYEGTSSGYALSLGIATMVSELGGGSQRIAEYLEHGIRGTFNMMRAIGMLDGDPAPPPDDQVVVETLTVIKPTTGGVLLSEFDASTVGQRVPAGTVLGRIVSAATFEELEVLRAPYDPSILILVREPVTHVAPGDYGFMVADGRPRANVQSAQAGVAQVLTLE